MEFDSTVRVGPPAAEPLFAQFHVVTLGRALRDRGRESVVSFAVPEAGFGGATENWMEVACLALDALATGCSALGFRCGDSSSSPSADRCRY